MIELIAVFGLGAMGWSASEYGMHRFVGHRKGSRLPFALEHTAHHAKAGYFTPNSKKVRMASAVLLPLWAVLCLITGVLIGSVFVAGYVAAYVGYEWAHHRMHTRPPTTRMGAWLRKHHFGHHYHHPSKNHGVTSPLWDVVFRTYRPVEKVHVPEKMVRKAIPWLVNPETGDVHSQFAQDYALRRKRVKASVS